jgi:hypothetical protein
LVPASLIKETPVLLVQLEPLDQLVQLEPLEQLVLKAQ